MADDLDGNIRAEVAQHPLGVIAGGFLLDHCRRARRAEACEQRRGLELRRSRRRFVDNRDRIARAFERQRQPSAIGQHDRPRTHADQRVQHALHGPLAQRGIAIEGRGYWAACNCADHQPAAGAGIAEIQGLARLGKARYAHAIDLPDALADPLDLSAEEAQDFGGIQYVSTLQKAGNPGSSDGQGSQNQRPVGNRLIAGGTDTAFQRSAPARNHGNRYF